MDDGYAPREGPYVANNRGDGLHASGNSSGALNELADPVKPVRGTWLLACVMRGHRLAPSHVCWRAFRDACVPTCALNE